MADFKLSMGGEHGVGKRCTGLAFLQAGVN